MTAISISQITSDGFNGYLVNNGIVELTILPELGGKVGSLRDLRNGREWLWRHPRFPYKKVPHGSSYIAEADTGGWDECFPSVAKCLYPSMPWKGAVIQDHGELWSQIAEFEVEEKTGEVKLLTRWKGFVLPYSFTRVITVSENSSNIRINYEAQNNGDQSLDFVWCIHPLLAIEPEMELILPSSVRYNVNGAIPEDLVSSQKSVEYPFSADGLNLPSLPKTNAGVAIKIWSDALLPANEGWAALRAHDGELRMRWDTTLLPQVAAWMNFGAWAGDGGMPYYNLGLEPCIGAQDSLNDAVNLNKLFATISPRGNKNWRLEIDLTA